VIFSARENSGLLARARRDGARGWISRFDTAAQIRTSLKAAIQGRSLWSDSDSRRLRASLIAPRLSNQPAFPLTARELQVLQLASEGCSNRRIAEQLDIAFETAKEHVRHVLAKLRVADRTQAAVMAERAGILRDRQSGMGRHGGTGG
jgi:DNA-binding NarL/FixJ family response regulator